MQFELSVQELIGFVITLMGTFWGLARMLLSQTQKQITDDIKRGLMDAISAYAKTFA